MQEVGRNGSLMGEMTPQRSARSYALDDQGDALSYTDAHGCQRVAPTCTPELTHCRSDEAPSARTERMTDGNRPAVRINARVVVSDAQLTERCDSLSSKCLVQLDDVEVSFSDTRSFQSFACRRDRPHAHQARRDTTDLASGSVAPRPARPATPGP